MSQLDLKSIALRFNDRINNQDVDGLAELMTEDYIRDARI
ncbi:MAG: nuclear transport factor 2 family protein [Candidatus Heimdallarchaeota archaeon]